MRETGRITGALVVAAGLWLMGAGPAGAAERDLWAGLAYLRAGAQVDAEASLTRYRDEERDPWVRQNVDRVLPLLRQPLNPEVRSYIAATLEGSLRVRPQPAAEIARSPYASRMFPVFP